MKTNHPVFYFATPEEAESAFYSAFEMGDIQLMEAVLADDDVCCVHPGAIPLLGREAVLESWAQILAGEIEPVIYLDVLNRTVFDEVAVHLVNERIASDHQPDSPSTVVLATNVYVRQKNGWRLMEHHASVPNRKPQKEQVDSQTTHEGPHTLQ